MVSASVSSDFIGAIQIVLLLLLMRASTTIAFNVFMTLTSDFENLFSNAHSHDIFWQSFTEIHPLSKEISRHAKQALTDGRRNNLKTPITGGGIKRCCVRENCLHFVLVQHRRSSRGSVQTRQQRIRTFSLGLID